MTARKLYFSATIEDGSEITIPCPKGKKVRIAWVIGKSSDLTLNELAFVEILFSDIGSVAAFAKPAGSSATETINCFIGAAPVPDMILDDTVTPATYVPRFGQNISLPDIWFQQNVRVNFGSNGGATWGTQCAYELADETDC